MKVEDLLHMIKTSLEVGAISLDDNVIIGDMSQKSTIWTGLKGVTAPAILLKDSSVINSNANMNLFFIKKI